MTGITSALNFIMTANGVPALYTTFAQSFSDATGFPLLSVIMIQVLDTPRRCCRIRHHRLSWQWGWGKCLQGRECCCVALAAVSYLILLPLDYLWYQALGKL